MSGKIKPWVDGLTYAETLAQTVSRHGQRDAVVFPKLGLRWTYEQFDLEVRRVARALIALGVQPGDHVGIWSTNWPEWILTQFGTAAFGGVLVNLNPAYRLHEFSYVLEHADITVLLATDSFKTSDYESMLAQSIEELGTIPYGEPLQSRKFPKLRHVVSIKNEPSVPGIWPWQAFVEQGDRIPAKLLADLAAGVKPDVPVNVQYTSGTTGHPKGATLSYRGLLMNAFYVGARQHFSEQDRL